MAAADKAKLDGMGAHSMKLLCAGVVSALGSPFKRIGDWNSSRMSEGRYRIIHNIDHLNYEECYRLFDEAYVFTPTTGPEWRALKAAGIE